MGAVTICGDFGAQEESVTVSIVSPSICHEAMGPDAMILVFCFKCILLQQIYFYKGMGFEEKKHGAERYGIENKCRCKLFC